jgi:hypothetical protein
VSVTSSAGSVASNWGTVRGPINATVRGEFCCINQAQDELVGRHADLGRDSGDCGQSRLGVRPLVRRHDRMPGALERVVVDALEDRRVRHERQVVVLTQVVQLLAVDDRRVVESGPRPQV